MAASSAALKRQMKSDSTVGPTASGFKKQGEGGSQQNDALITSTRDSSSNKQLHEQGSSESHGCQAGTESEQGEIREGAEEAGVRYDEGTRRLLPPSRDGALYSGAFGRARDLRERMVKEQAFLIRCNPIAFQEDMASQADAKHRYGDLLG